MLGPSMRRLSGIVTQVLLSNQPPEDLGCWSFTLVRVEQSELLKRIRRAQGVLVEITDPRASPGLRHELLDESSLIGLRDLLRSGADRPTELGDVERLVHSASKSLVPHLLHHGPLRRIESRRHRIRITMRPEAVEEVRHVRSCVEHLEHPGGPGTVRKIVATVLLHVDRDNDLMAGMSLLDRPRDVAHLHRPRYQVYVGEVRLVVQLPPGNLRVSIDHRKIVANSSRWVEDQTEDLHATLYAPVNAPLEELTVALTLRIDRHGLRQPV